MAGTLGTFGEAEQHVCVWPGRLELQAGEFGGRFTQTWQAFAESWLPLPGDGDNWPLEVRVDGAAAPVIEHDGAPAVRVTRGRHVVQGVFSWPERPESMAVPESVAAIDLSVDGQSIVPVQREGAALWLGRADEGSGQADSLTVQVYRKLTDGLPPILETRIALEVSGRGREEIVGVVLPIGWVPVRLDGSLPILLGADGRLRAQVRPGNWQIVVVARGLQPLDRVTRGEEPARDARGEPVTAWPREEVWSFQAQSELRVATASGGRAVDPSQVGVPAEWQPLPAFVLEPAEGLEIEERSRGLAGDEANRLSLEREAWLDFDGAGMSARDRVSGRMVREFRLDLEPPFTLRRATAGGEPLLVTTGATSGWTGVELRSPDVNLEASSRVESLSGALPATGWRTPFEGVKTTLHLPPGRILVAAAGTDSSPDAWLDRWSLLDVFLLLVTSLLAGRLFGPTGGVLALVALVLGHHESSGPLWALLVVLVLSLLGRAVPGGTRLTRIVAAMRVLALVVLIVVLVPFVAQQLRLALYPQLESHAVSFDFDSFELMTVRSEAPASAAMPAAPPPQTEVDRNASLNEPAGALGYLSGSAKGQAGDGRAKAVRRFQRYATMNTFQAGGGEPTWTWHTARLSWSGPVLPGQTLRLWITPAWLTRALRVVLVGLLLWLLARLARLGIGRQHHSMSPTLPTPPPIASATAAGVVAFLLVSFSGATPAIAQSIPDPALLDQLRARLLAAPDCVPNCGHLEDARVRLQGRRLEIDLTLHAAALVAVPLPVTTGESASGHLERVAIDGVAQAQLLRHGDETWVALSRGVHRVELHFRVLAADVIDLRFPLPPGRLFVDSPGWDATGRSGYQLLTDTLSLARRQASSSERSSQRSSATGGGSPTGEGTRVPPFVVVTRDLDLDLDWSAKTRVRRVAPAEGSFTVEVPLLPGESVLTPGFEARAGAVTAAFGAGVGEVEWESRFERVDAFTLTAGDLAQRAEIWRVVVSPEWHADFTGPPAVRPADAETYWVHEFRPLPGESLGVAVARPAAVAGPTLAIDGASLDSTVGQRAAEHTLTLTLRSTRGGQHAIHLPKEAEVLDVRIDGTVLNLRPESGSLTLPVHPGPQTVVVRFRDAGAAASGPLQIIQRMPAIDLGAPASNVQMVLRLPRSRWLLATTGPLAGPAVLFWGELLVMVLGAAALSRWVAKTPQSPPTPLSFTSWLLLGLGFATASWIALAFVVVWLLALEARRRLDPASLSWWRFDFVQLALVGLTVIAMGCLFYAVPHGLLGSPDMRVEGNGSTAHELRWFADRTPGALPGAKAFTLPLLVFRAAMLAWALWLAAAVVRWLRWAYACLSEAGAWKKPGAVAGPPASPSVIGATPEPSGPATIV